MDYLAAGRRHHDDAGYLAEDRRLASADHLVGLGAECLIKHLIVTPLGGALRRAGSPRGPSGAVVSPHLPEVWDELSGLLSGRRGQLADLVSESNPFAGWDVAHRYSDGSVSTEQVVDGRLAATTRLDRLVVLAEQLGALP